MLAKVGLRVMPKNEVLDSQGRTIEKTLKQNDYKLSSCVVGKYIELSVEGKDKQEIEASVKEMAEFILYNPLIETYSLEFL